MVCDMIVLHHTLVIAASNVSQGSPLTPLTGASWVLEAHYLDSNLTHWDSIFKEACNGLHHLSTRVLAVGEDLHPLNGFHKTRSCVEGILGESTHCTTTSLLHVHPPQTVV